MSAMGTLETELSNLSGKLHSVIPTTLPAIAERLNLIHLTVEDLNRFPSQKRADPHFHLQAVMLCGILLLDAKEKVKRGDWLLWLESNCPKIHPRTATNYMRLARALGDGDDCSIANN